MRSSFIRKDVSLADLSHSGNPGRKGYLPFMFFDAESGRGSMSFIDPTATAASRLLPALDDPATVGGGAYSTADAVRLELLSSLTCCVLTLSFFDLLSSRK